MTAAELRWRAQDGVDFSPGGNPGQQTNAPRALA